MRQGAFVLNWYGDFVRDVVVVWRVAAFALFVGTRKGRLGSSTLWLTDGRWVRQPLAWPVCPRVVRLLQEATSSHSSVHSHSQNPPRIAGVVRRNSQAIGSWYTVAAGFLRLDHPWKIKQRHHEIIGGNGIESDFHLSHSVKADRTRSITGDDGSRVLAQCDHYWFSMKWPLANWEAGERNNKMSAKNFKLTAT